MPVRAVLLDAMGTLVRLQPPAPRLAAALAAAGHPNPTAVVEAALRAEIAHYRANLLRGRDDASLAALRRECAEVLGAHLTDAPPAARLTAMLVDAIRVVPFPEVPAALAALRTRGLRLAVVSDWDCGMAAHLDAAGLLPALDAVVTAAVAGAEKPDARPFATALASLGVAPEEAVHVGDRPDRDVAGARALGMGAVLVDRHGAHGDVAPRIAHLGALPPLVAGG